MFETGLDQPVHITHANDGSERIFIVERAGVIRILRDGTVLPTPFLDISSIVREAGSEEGLLSVAFPPDYDVKGYFYVYFTDDRQGNRGNNLLARFHVTGDPDVADPLSEELILNFDHPTFSNHNGGQIAFGPDGYLYITLGELERPEEVQDLSLLPGKILRVDRNGVAAPGNPFEGQLNIDARIYAYGLRNAFDFDFHPVTGTIIAVDNGDSTDEINRIVPGGNYGHPDVIGPSDNADFIDPIIYYEFPVGPAGASFYSGDKLPEFKNNFFFCQFHQGGLLHRVQFADDGDEVVIEDTLLAGSCTSDVAEGPDGYLYFADVNSGVIHRITDGG
ncbi:MAG: PQQ-dependent sugar dehydrogenase [Chloroflexi bacterium]|nr:PQQ-dependent sugar dehydrogenase [Chloroflexota bacterium]